MNKPKKSLTPSELIKKEIPDIKFIRDLEEAKKKEIDWRRVISLARKLRNTLKESDNTVQPATF